MTVSQNIDLINQVDASYDDMITVTDVPKGNFMAVTNIMAPANGSTIREITVSLMPADWAEGGTNTIGTGLFVRQSGETAIKVTVQDSNGADLASNTTNYSS